MALFGSSSMAGDIKIGATAFFLAMWIGYFLITGAAAIPRAELDDMLPVLRCRGYNHIGNAIKTSDLIKDCLADESMEVALISGESGLRSDAVSDLILLPSPAILTALLSNHTLSIAVLGRCRTVHIAVNGVPPESPGLYRSSHGLAGALIPLSHFPSCCLPQSPIRATLVETTSLSAYAGPHALLRPQSASSNGDLPHPPETLDISIGFSKSSNAAALTAAAAAAFAAIHLFLQLLKVPPRRVRRTYEVPFLDDDGPIYVGPPSPTEFPPPANFYPLDNNRDGFTLILHMVMNTLKKQRMGAVYMNEDAFFPVSEEYFGARLRRYYESRLKILTQPQYAMFRSPDDVLLVIEMPDGTTLHLGQVPHYFINGLLFDTSFIVRIFSCFGSD